MPEGRRPTLVPDRVEAASWLTTGRPPARPPAPEAVLHSRPAIAPQRVRSASRGDVAQLEEHRVRIAGVRGSSPLISTTSHAIGIPKPPAGQLGQPPSPRRLWRRHACLLY